MAEWLRKMLYRISQWTYGRYGTDELNVFLIISALALGLLSCFPFLWVLSPFATALIVWSCFRSLSKNITGRSRELSLYYRTKSKLTSKFSLYKQMWGERKTHRYFKCKNCKTLLRVPKRSNKIEVTCPKCGRKTIK